MSIFSLKVQHFGKSALFGFLGPGVQTQAQTLKGHGSLTHMSI